MNFPLSPDQLCAPGAARPTSQALPALLAMLDALADPTSPPFDEGSLSIGALLIMLAYITGNDSEAESQIMSRFRRLVEKIPTGAQRGRYFERCALDIKDWRRRVERASTLLDGCFHGLETA